MLDDSRFLAVVDATPLVSIDLIVRNAGGAILLGRRANRPAQGWWFVPGGRIQKNERVDSALRRISRREIGLELAEAELIGVFDHFYPDNFLGAPSVSTHYVVLGMKADWPSQHEVVGDAQHDEFRWWRVADILSSPEVHEHTKAYFRADLTG